MITTAQRLREEGMYEGIEKGMYEGIEKGLKEGKKEGKFEVAKQMLKKGLDLKFIAEVTGLPIKQLKLCKN